MAMKKKFLGLAMASNGSFTSNKCICMQIHNGDTITGNETDT